MGRKGIIRTLTLLVAVTSFSAFRVAAQDEPSVADAARRARQQKQASAKPASVITNDTLAPAPNPAATPASPAAPSESATPAPPSAPVDTAGAAQASPGAGSAESKSAAESDGDGEQKKQHIAKLKEEIARKQEQIKFLQSDLALKQDTFYRNPDYQHDADGKNKLESMKADIQQAQDELAGLQAKLAGLGPQEEQKPAPPSRP